MVKLVILILSVAILAMIDSSASLYTYPRKVLTATSGNLTNPTLHSGWVDVPFLLRAPRGYKISIQFDTFKSGDQVKIKDGRRSREEIYIFEQNGRIYKQIRSKEVISPPYQYNANTKRLFVTFKTGSGQMSRFSAFYQFYPDNLCEISDLDEDYMDLQCNDTYTIAPTAGSCTYQKSCPTHFQRRGKIDCEEGYWSDNVDCLPDGDIVEGQQCEIDGDDLNVACPYTFDDIAKYYLVTYSDQESDMLDQSSRSVGTTGKCNYFCYHTPRKICKYWRRLKKYLDFSICVLCRFKYRCKQRNVVVA